MPELPEVETVRRGLERLVLRRSISAIEILNPLMIRGDAATFRRCVEGRRIESLRRKGKLLVMSLRRKNSEPVNFLALRLGMTGQVVVSSSRAPRLPHTHVLMVLDDGREELRYRDPRRFGMLRCCSAEEVEKLFSSLGPDALEMTEEQFDHVFEGRRGAVKGLLLNQHALAGLGNIYADEALFEARIHPQTQAGEIARPSRRLLIRAIRRVLQRAINLQGTSFRDYTDIEGRPGNFEPRLRAYGRTGEPCRRCGTPIRRIIICGRSSHFCPRCQPRPRRIAPPGKPRKTVTRSQDVPRRRKQ